MMCKATLLKSGINTLIWKFTTQSSLIEYRHSAEHDFENQHRKNFLYPDGPPHQCYRDKERLKKHIDLG